MKGKRNDKDKTVSGMKNTANYITAGRIGLALSLLFVPPLTILFYIVYLLCGLSDMADGLIARKTHTESAFGAKLDSIADFSFYRREDRRKKVDEGRPLRYTFIDRASGDCISPPEVSAQKANEK